mmetsp:Transcript_90832/g.256560  ORF Transcript_90832/g.256560 Transcript_90832/m.256560 type:complete len:434 (-) Transcript_90832:445-1746(-)
MRAASSTTMAIITRPLLLNMPLTPFFTFPKKRMPLISHGSIGISLVIIAALFSSSSMPLLRAIAVRVSGEMFFIMSSAAFIMSGSFMKASMASVSMLPGPAAELLLDACLLEFIFELSSIIFCICSGDMFFIISDICAPSSGLEPICSAACRIMSASLESPDPAMPLAISATCFNMFGSSKALLMADMSTSPPPNPPACLDKSLFLSSSLMFLKLSTAVLSMSGFFVITSIRLFIVSASTPGRSGEFCIILWRSSGFIFFMASVACVNMSGFCESLSKASAMSGLLPPPLLPPGARDRGAPGLDVGACVLALAAFSAAFSAAWMSDSFSPRSLHSFSNRFSSDAIFSSGDSRAACLTSAKASDNMPSSKRARPRRKIAFTLWPLISSASLHLSIAFWCSFRLRWHSAAFNINCNCNCLTSSPACGFKLSSARL